jgi:hypothetical protein
MTAAESYMQVDLTVTEILAFRSCLDRSSAETLVILTDVFSGIPQSLRANTEIVLEIRQ